VESHRYQIQTPVGDANNTKCLVKLHPVTVATSEKLMAITVFGL
jgi:hypothetical protein